MDLSPAALDAAGSAPPRPTPSPPASDPFVLYFGSFAIRATLIDGGLSFVAIDLCRALKLRMGPKITPSKYLKGIYAGPRRYLSVATLRGPQDCGIVSAGEALALTYQRSRRIDASLRRWIKRQVRDCTDARATRDLAVAETLDRSSAALAVE